MSNMLLGVARRTRSAAVLGLRPVVPAFRGASARWLSDSHDDFKPQKKPLDLDDEGEVQALIDDHVKSHSVLLYMKGTPSAPQCGFSQQVVRVLHAAGTEFSSINVLEHPEIRDGIKTYSEWPTIPQLYVGGEFVGGCDIVTDLYQSGELQTLLAEKGLIEAEK